MTDRDQFVDRIEAAKLLAIRLKEYRGCNPLVLAIPRGAVPMAKVIADELEGELDVVLVHKFGAPYDPEFALGAVDENGWAYVAPHAQAYGVDSLQMQQEQTRQVQMLRKRRDQYTPYRPPIDPIGRVAIIVDDGIATGATMIAALHAVRAREPAELICAVPVAAMDSLDVIRTLADKIVCIHASAHMGSVGAFYRDFQQVADEHVIEILSHTSSGKHDTS